MDLYAAFKGTGNSSHKLVSGLGGEMLFLTNSFAGLEKDIADLQGDYDAIYMFGTDKTLKGEVRVERCAIREHKAASSKLDLDAFVSKLNENGIRARLGSDPKQTLCNDAYWHMLHKYDGRVVFFHVPSIRYIDEDLIRAFKRSL